MADAMKLQHARDRALSEAEPFLEYRSPPIQVPRRSQLGLVKSVVISFMLGAILTSIIWFVAGTVRGRDIATIRSHPATDCGITPIEARAQGCHFQLWSYSWVPPRCFDTELHNEFLQLHDKEGWQYLRNVSSLSPEGETEWVREEIPLSKVLEGEQSGIYSTWGQHYWHCAFYLRRFFKATGGLTNRDRDLHHSIHCQEWLSNPFAHDWKTPNIRLQVGYHECDASNALRILDEEQSVSIEASQKA